MLRSLVLAFTAVQSCIPPTYPLPLINVVSPANRSHVPRADVKVVLSSNFEPTEGLTKLDVLLVPEAGQVVETQTVTLRRDDQPQRDDNTLTYRFGDLDQGTTFRVLVDYQQRVSPRCSFDHHRYVIGTFTTE